MREKFAAARWGDARAAGEWVEYVGKEHAAANGWDQRGAGDGGCAGASGFSADDAALDWDTDSQRRFAAGRAVEFLHGDFAHQERVRTAGRRKGAAVFVRRVAGWNEFA